MFEDIFKGKKSIPKKLTDYGFERDGNSLKYSTAIINGTFFLSVYIDKNDKVDTTLTEAESGEEYVLYKTNAIGEFVGEIREAIENVLQDISEKCFEPSIFRTEQSRAVISYVRRKYLDELEYLWARFPDNAVFRRKDNRKWYGAILTVEKSKLGIADNEIAEIIDLRIEPDLIEELLSHEHFYPGWHMNKKSWYTIILDGSIPNEELFRRIDESYQLASKAK